MAAPRRPRPVPDALSTPFWEATAHGRLAVQRCRACRRYQHPPGAVCSACASPDLGFEDVSGRGRVFSFTTNHQQNVAGFEEAVPYVNLIVELDEQPMLFMLSDLPAAEADWVEIGAPVLVEFEALPDGAMLPQFRSAPGGEGAGQ